MEAFGTELYKLKPKSQSELTLIMFNMELTHLGSVITKRYLDKNDEKLVIFDIKYVILILFWFI